MRLVVSAASSILAIGCVHVQNPKPDNPNYVRHGKL